MDRRHFEVVFCGALFAMAVHGQERVYRVGYLSWQDEGSYHDVTLRGFLDGLRSEGFVEGKNLQIVFRSASNNADRFKPLANDLARIPVDLYFAPATPMATAAWYADKKTPIIVATILDPVELKFVKTLARPGTRVTGVTTMSDELTIKRMQLLMEVVPGLKRVGVVIDEAMRDACTQEMDHAMRAARQLGLTLVAVHIDRPELLDVGFKKLLDAKVQAVTSTLLSTRNNLEKEYAEAALKHKLPSMFEQEIGARHGGLMSYGPDFEDVFRRAGRHAGRVLKGANPAELAMEEPRQFRMVLNLKTARELGITISPAVRLRADEVIE
ncbi:MAG: ABC transporter substrate-binding protein [Burkholderiaceae bacterium]|nr:ABC transporter substrate-binding protein [Burkholderiaceae bacterium]